jgi:hypothetical protein
MNQMNLKRTFRVILLLFLFFFSMGPVSAQAVTRVGFFEVYDVRPGNRIEVPIEVRGVTELYGIDLEIEFDPAIVQVEDADPDKPGTQPALGMFLDAGLVLFNDVDNQAGTVKFVMTQVNPAEPKSGDGIVLILYFVGLQEGDADLRINFVELAKRTGEGIDVEGVDGSLVVSAQADDKDATPIPVQDPTQIVVIPTVAPTTAPTPTEVPDVEPTPVEPTEAPPPTPTEVPDEEATPVEPTEAPPPTPTEVPDEETTPVEPTEEPASSPTEEPVEEPTPVEIGAIDQDVDDEPAVDEDPTVPETPAETPEVRKGFSILQYWWAVLLAVLLAIGMGIYLTVTRL